MSSFYHLEHGNRVRRICWPRLCHVPMLDDASTVHTIYVGQSNWFLISLVDPDVSKSDVAVKAHTEDSRGHVRNDVYELVFVGDASLGIKGIVLGKVDGDIGVEGVYNIFLYVELVDEGKENLSLIALWRWMPGTVGFHATVLNGGQ